MIVAIGKAKPRQIHFIGVQFACDEEGTVQITGIFDGVWPMRVWSGIHEQQ